MILRSIRIRITLLYLSVLTFIIAAFAVAIYLLVARNLSQTTDNNLAEIGRSVEADLRKEEADIAAARLLPAPAEEDEDEKGPIDADDELPLTIESAITEEVEDLRSRDYGFLVLDQDGGLIGSTIDFPALHESAINISTDTTFADLSIAEQLYRVHQMKLTLDGKPFRLIVTRSLREQSDFLFTLRRVFIGAFPVALILAGVCGYFLARRSLAPIVTMSSQAAKIGSSTLNERLIVKNENDELGGLAKVFNALLSRLEASFNQQKQFMADASHELRTPLAIVRGESEVAISKQDRPVAEYRESLAIVHDESLRLTKIVDDLFTLARADSGQLKPQLSPVFLDEILIDCVHAAGSLARNRKVAIELATIKEMKLDGDESLLHRMFLNLLDNAIKYNRDGGSISVRASVEDDVYSVLIKDTGQGIPDGDREEIFKRFYRVDRSRTRDNIEGKNGVGLGLSIAAWIAEAHRGSLRLKESDSHGSVFEVRFPRSN